MPGVNAETGEVLDGFAHVEQSLEKIFTTYQGERVMREWFGNPGLRLLGENTTQQNVLLWFNILWMLIELYEPRFRVTRFEFNDADRLGGIDATIHGLYRPYAHLDWQQARLFVSVQNGTVRLAAGA
jgi:uncharacterized protein